MSGLIDYVIPPQCYQKFVQEHNFEADCIKIVLSKLVGYAIILGSVLVKLPQITKIMGAGSAEGINLFSVVLELVATTGILAYSFANGFPFSSYGEATFMTLQLVIIMSLVLAYGSGRKSSFFWTSIYLGLLSVLLSPMAPMDLLVALQGSGIVLVFLGRTMQIFTNCLNQSTGQLSLVTVLLQFVGGAARILTTLQETGDLITVVMYVVSTGTNGIILAQIFYYWGSVMSLASPRSSSVTTLAKDSRTQVRKVK